MVGVSRRIGSGDLNSEGLQDCQIDTTEDRRWPSEGQEDGLEADGDSEAYGAEADSDQGGVARRTEQRVKQPGFKITCVTVGNVRTKNDCDGAPQPACRLGNDRVTLKRLLVRETWQKAVRQPGKREGE